MDWDSSFVNNLSARGFVVGYSLGHEVTIDW